MPCFRPLKGYRSLEVGPRGRAKVVFSPTAGCVDRPVDIPCGQCIGCRLERSRQWAVRCMHEAAMHEDNSFLTLTYSDRHYPPGGSLVKRDLQLFFKRLRKRLESKKVRYFACGEYGDSTDRPHYHVILFGHWFDDVIFYKNSHSGHALYVSEDLDGLWSNGNCYIGDVSFDSAAYVARYCLKKVNGPAAGDRYQKIDTRTGEVYDCEPEFALMSRRPGIGRLWYEKYADEVLKDDTVVANGARMLPPRYYDTVREASDLDGLLKTKIERAKRGKRREEDNTPGRRKVREKVTLSRTKTFLTRGLE